MLPFSGVFDQKLGDSLLRYPTRGFSVGVHGSGQGRERQVGCEGSMPSSLASSATF